MALAAGFEAEPTPAPTAPPQGFEFDTTAAPAPAWTPNDKDLRADGTRKGNGFLGVLKRPDGGISSELSIGVEINGKETEIPTLVPTLNQDEISYLLATPADKIGTADPARFGQIQSKAEAFAKQRLAAGKDPFAALDESPQSPGGAPPGFELETAAPPAASAAPAGFEVEHDALPAGFEPDPAVTGAQPAIAQSLRAVKADAGLMRAEGQKPMFTGELSTQAFDAAHHVLGPDEVPPPPEEQRSARIKAAIGRAATLSDLENIANKEKGTLGALQGADALSRVTGHPVDTTALPPPQSEDPVRPGLLQRAADYLTRPISTVAGAAKAAIETEGDPEAIGRAAWRGITGESKVFMRDVLEAAGVPELGNVGADLQDLPATAATKGTAPVEHQVRVTGRDALGFLGDVYLDPINYLSAGTGRALKLGSGVALSTAGEAALDAEIARGVAAGLGRDAARSAAETTVKGAIDSGTAGLTHRGGVQWAGMTIPGTPQAGRAFRTVARAAADQARSTAAGAALAKRAEQVSALFNRDRLVRGYPEYVRDKQRFLNLTHGDELDIKDEAAIIFKDTKPADRVAITNAIDQGKVDTLPPQLQKVARAVDASQTATRQQEIGKGLGESILDDYMLHAYSNYPALRQEHGVGGGVSTALRSNQERIIPTLEEAKSLGLKPVTEDAHDLFIMRKMASSRAQRSADLIGAVRTKFGTEASFRERIANELVPAPTLPERSPTAAPEPARSGKLFHGSGSDSLTVASLDTGSTSNRFGPGLYLADNAETSKGYGAGNLYEVRLRPRLKIADVDEPSEAVAADMIRAARAAARGVEGEESALSAIARVKLDSTGMHGLHHRLRGLVSPESLNAEMHALGYDGVSFSAGFHRGKYRETVLFKPQDAVESLGRATPGAPATPATAPKAAGKPELFIPRRIAEDMKSLGGSPEITGALGQMLKGYDTLTNLWKGSVTSLFPAFHVRNAITNVINSFLDIGVTALNPIRHAEATAMLLGREGKLFSKFGEEYQLSELRKLFRAEDLDQGFAGKIELQTRNGRPLGDNPLFRGGRNVGNAIEGNARAMHFLSSIRRGFTPEMAAVKTKQFLFDYGNLSSFEREAVRRAIPFYTWTSKNVRLQLHALMTEPGRQAVFLKAFATPGDPKQIERDMRNWPDYVTEGLARRVGTDKQGNPIVLWGTGMPIEDLNRVWPQTRASGNVAGEAARKNVLSGLNPMVKFWVEEATGKDLFLDRDLKDINQVYSAFGPSMEKLPPAIKSWLGFKVELSRRLEDRYLMDPTKLHILRSFVLSRLYTTTGKLFDETKDPVTRFLNTFTGARLGSVDAETQIYPALRQRADDRLTAARHEQQQQQRRVLRDGPKQSLVKPGR